MPASLFSQNVDLHSLGTRVGAASPSISESNTFSIGLRAQSKAISRNFFLHLYFDYWAVQWQKEKIDWNWRLFSSGISATQRFDFRHTNIKPFIGGGIGLNMNFPTVKSDTKIAPQENRDLDLSLHCIGGVIFPINEMLSAVIELKYVVGGRLDYAGLWVGVNYHINTNKDTAM